MDFKRLILYFVLALLALSLWQEWQKEHPAPKAVAPQQASTTSQTSAQSPVSDLSNVPFAKSKHPSNKQVPLTKARSTAETLIHVHTDVLNVNIDTDGGKIVMVSLPKYPNAIKQKDKPFVLMSQSQNEFYGAQSGISNISAKNKALNYKSSASSYALASGQNKLIVPLTYKSASGMLITKQFIFSRGKYDVELNYIINNQSTAPWQGQIFSQLTRTPPLKHHGLLHSMTTFTGAAYSTPDKPYTKLSFKNIAKENLDQTVKGGWVAMIQQYFLSAWIPNQHQDSLFYSRSNNNNEYSIGFVSPMLHLAAGQTLQHNLNLYIGPAVMKNLKATAPHLALTIDYGWLWFISILILKVMQYIHSVIGNWGWSIVLVTVLIKAVFYKLSASSYRSMANMRKLQPKLNALKERHKDDKQQFSKAMMELYRKEKVNPLGGCLPIVIQIPVFIALYWVLLESVELRQAPFMFWIHDLAARDPYFILPILMGISMFVQQKLSPAPPDPTQAKVMMMLPIVFTFFFLNFPAGLVLYWLVNNILSIAQQWYVMYRIENPKPKTKKA